MKRLLISICILMTVATCQSNAKHANYVSTSGKQTLLYYVTSEESLNTIDKLNKVSLLLNNNVNYNSGILSAAVDTFNDDYKSYPDDSSSHASMPKLYSLLYAHSDYMLIGTKSRMINISLENVNSITNKYLVWPQSSMNSKFKPKTDCLTSKLSSYQCQNYIRTAVPLVTYSQESELVNILIVCGTNSSQPYCRKYNASGGMDSDTFTLIDEFQSPQFFTLNKMSKNNKFDSQNMIPAFSHNSDAIYFVNPGSFTQEPSINKQVVLKNSKFSSRLVKTPRGALKNANFRSSFEHNDKVYFFYSETDLADETNGLTFKTPYSLIGEVCADDNGRASFSGDANRFITFKKSIIYCYLPDYKDEFYFKYTEIQAVSKPIKRLNSSAHDDEDVFYAIFTFRRINSIDSALCKYKVKTIENTMKGYFKSMEYHEDQSIVYKKPLDTCNKYKELKESTLNEYNKEMNKYYKFEMEQTVNEPALFALNNVKFTSIVVDQASWSNSFNDVIFIGTEDGRVLKLITREITIDSKQKKFQQPIIVQEYQMFNAGQPVTSLIIHNSGNQAKLIAISDEQIKTVQLDSFCSNYLSCAECVVSQDPYCVWSVGSSKCISIRNRKNNRSISDPLNGDINKCYEMKSNRNESNLDLNVLYSIKIDSQTDSGGVSTTSQIQFDSTAYRKLDSIVNKTNNSSGLLIAIFLTALISSVASVLFTWLFIKKRYQMAEYVAKHLLQTSITSSNQSNRSSTSSYNNYSGKKFKVIDPDQQKCNNYYEKPNKQDIKDLNGPRYITPDSPITSTTLTNMDSSETSNQHSPNGNQLLIRSLNSALSSSDDSFEPPQTSHNNRRTTMFSSIESGRLTATNSDIINITTNLLSRPDRPDSNV